MDNIKYYKTSGGTEYWIDENNKYHREGDLPAYISNEVEIYYFHGLYHRKNGAAVIIYNYNPPYQNKSYWWMGEKIECNSDEEWKSIVALKVFW